MYIDYVFYQQIDSASFQTIEISSRYKSYFEDLYRRYGESLKMCLREKIVTTGILTEQLFQNEIALQSCVGSDYILMPSWAYELSSTSAVPGFGLKNLYNWVSPIIDIRDCGVLCVYYAMKLMLAMSVNQNIQKIVCFTVENAIPALNQYRGYPSINYIGLISLTQNAFEAVQIISSDIYFTKSIEFIQPIINHKMLMYSISPEQFQIFINDDTKNSSGFLYFIMQKIYQCREQYHYLHIFVVDSDAMSGQYAIAHLYVG